MSAACIFTGGTQFLNGLANGTSAINVSSIQVPNTTGSNNSINNSGVVTNDLQLEGLSGGAPYNIFASGSVVTIAVESTTANGSISLSNTGGKAVTLSCQANEQFDVDGSIVATGTITADSAMECTVLGATSSVETPEVSITDGGLITGITNNTIKIAPTVDGSLQLGQSTTSANIVDLSCTDNYQLTVGGNIICNTLSATVGASSITTSTLNTTNIITGGIQGIFATSIIDGSYGVAFAEVGANSQSGLLQLENVPFGTVAWNSGAICFMTNSQNGASAEGLVISQAYLVAPTNGTDGYANVEFSLYNSSGGGCTPGRLSLLIYSI